jgi:7-carboxy-7-deazaguanine synthase
MQEDQSKENQPEKLRRFPVVEIFGPTLQGEGRTIGQRTVFLRLGGCDYRCAMCDSMHAVDPLQIKQNATMMSALEIFTQLFKLCTEGNCTWVTLSGGNPCMWDLTDLVLALKSNDFGVTVETQGTLAPHWLKYCDYITVSPKGPGMGEKFEQQKFDAFMDEFIGHPGISVKIVAFDARDLEFASMIAEQYPSICKRDQLFISLGNPNPPKLGLGEGQQMDAASSDELLRESLHDLATLVDDMKEYPSLKTARILPQLHTWLWGNAKGR